MKNWLPNLDEWVPLGFILTAMVGGFVGFLKAYEQAGVQVSWRVAFWSFFRRVLMGGFAGFLIYQLAVIYGWSNAWTHIMSGITGIFASEFFEVLWSIGRARLQGLGGVKEERK